MTNAIEFLSRPVVVPLGLPLNVLHIILLLALVYMAFSRR